jgi:hypothetical protein
MGKELLFWTIARCVGGSVALRSSEAVICQPVTDHRLQPARLTYQPTAPSPYQKKTPKAITNIFSEMTYTDPSTKTIQIQPSIGARGFIAHFKQQTL